MVGTFLAKLINHATLEYFAKNKNGYFTWVQHQHIMYLNEIGDTEIMTIEGSTSTYNVFKYYLF